MVVFNGKFFGSYCTIVSLVSIALNVLFLVVTRLKRVEGFQEVLIFLQSIAFALILMAICMMTVAPQAILMTSSFAFLPHGLGANFDTAVLNAITAFGFGCYLYIVLNFAIMFLFRYNITCKTSSLSTLFSRRNIFAFLCMAAVYSLISSVLIYYSTVDPKYLLERLNRTKDIGDLDVLPQFDSLFTQNREVQSATPQTTTFRPPATIEDSGHGQMMSEGSTALRTLNVFGYDYTRNPMILFSAGIFSISSILGSLLILITSLVVTFKLRGHQSSMSDKSQEEHQQLTKVLILVAYVPIVLALIPPLNLAICYFRHGCLTIQEYVPILVLSPVAFVFPFLNIVLVPHLRLTAFQVVICMYWRKQRNAETKQKIQNAANAQEDLNEEQLKALKTITKK